jgi:FKBP-type peptidyl-prolyl cis-trans isomerase FkpA
MIIRPTLVPLLAGLLLLTSCEEKESKKDFQTTPTGLKYKIFPAKAAGDAKDGAGRKAKDGEVLTMAMEWHALTPKDKDTLLYSTYKQKTPATIPLMKPTFKGSMEEAFAMVSPGDSGVFQVSADSFYAKTIKQPMPPHIKKGSLLTFNIKVDKIMSQEEAMADQQKMMEQRQKEMMAQAEGQIKIDDAKIQEYIKANNLKAEKTPSGLYYIITKPGTGPNAKAGQNVTVHYTGTNLRGKKFDSSKDRNQPFTFVLGQGQVIRGWDEGIALLNKGAQATLLIPSPMAYGPQERGPEIGANEILRFDVELIDFK